MFRVSKASVPSLRVLELLIRASSIQGSMPESECTDQQITECRLQISEAYPKFLICDMRVIMPVKYLETLGSNPYANPANVPSRPVVPLHTIG